MLPVTSNGIGFEGAPMTDLEMEEFREAVERSKGDTA